MLDFSIVGLGSIHLTIKLESEDRAQGFCEGS